MGTDQPCDFGADLFIVEHLVSYQGMSFVIFTETDHHVYIAPKHSLVSYQMYFVLTSFILAIALRKFKQLGVRKHVCSYSPYSMIQSASGRIGLVKRYMSQVPVKNYPKSGWQNVSCTLPRRISELQKNFGLM